MVDDLIRKEGSPKALFHAKAVLRVPVVPALLVNVASMGACSALR
jgi:hypothetical protein